MATSGDFRSNSDVRRRYDRRLPSGEGRRGCARVSPTSSVAVVRQRQRAPLLYVPEKNRRPLGANKRRFPFGEWCPRKGRSAVVAGGGRKGLEKGRRQRWSAEAHGHGGLWLCARCAVSAERSAKQYSDILGKNISLNAVREQNTRLQNKGPHHLNVRRKK